MDNNSNNNSSRNILCQIWIGKVISKIGKDIEEIEEEDTIKEEVTEVNMLEETRMVIIINIGSRINIIREIKMEITINIGSKTNNIRSNNKVNREKLPWIGLMLIKRI